MKQHYCSAEKTTIAFEGECNWCGEKEVNEKIKELIEQARKKPMGDSWCYTSPKEFEQKLAELIIQECIDIISPYTIRMSRPGEEYIHPIQEIKKHFGVEL